MKLKLRDNLNSLLRGRINCGLATAVSLQTERIYELISGTTVLVDTNRLFMDQFNTQAITGVSNNGLRIWGWMVEEVIDDVRHSLNKCDWCGNQQEKSETVDSKCHKCGKTEYLRSLLPQIMLDDKNVGIQ